MTESVEQQGKRLRRRNLVSFGIRVVLWVAITYSFIALSEWYASHRKMGEIAYALNTFLTGSILVSIGKWLVVSWYSRRMKKNDRVRGNFVLGVGQIAGIATVVFAVIAVMLALGINPKEFLTSITIVAMAIALLFRDYITNMISGLLIMFSDRFTIGDNIKIGEYEGRILDITLVNIEVKNEDDDIVLIPNNTAFTANIINQSLHNSRKVTVEFQLPLAQAHNQEALEQRMQALFARHADDVIAGSYRMRLLEIDKESAHYKVQVQIHSRGSLKKQQARDAILAEVLAHSAQEAQAVKSS